MPLYRRFFMAAIWCALTLGAAFGAVNLLFAHLALGPVHPAHNQVHGAFQLTGFVLLFIMGAAYHTVPRFFATELAAPRIAHISFGLALAGLIIRAYGMLGALVPAAPWFLLLGTLIQAAAIAAFAAVMVLTWRHARPRGELFHLYLAAGTFWWVAAALLTVAGGVRAARTGESGEAAAWNQPAYVAALLGGASMWMQGMLLRLGGAFLGHRPLRPRLVLHAFPVAQVGIHVAVLGAALRGLAGADLVEGAGFVIFGAALVAFAVGARLLEPAAADATPAADLPTRRAIRFAAAFSVLYLGLAAAHTLLEFVNGAAPSALHDGARHALALGLITPILLGMAGAMIPAFSRAAAVHPELRSAGLALVLIAALLRQAQVIAHLGAWPGLLTVSGLSGGIGAIGFGLAGTSLLLTLRAARRRGPLDIVPIASVGRRAPAIART